MDPITEAEVLAVFERWFGVDDPQDQRSEDPFDERPPIMTKGATWSSIADASKYARYFLEMLAEVRRQP